MIQQVLFPLGLYVAGLVWGAIFRNEISFSFICVTGFLWGAFLWVFAALVLLSFSFPYTLTTMACLMSVIVLLSVVINIRRNTWRLNMYEIAYLAVICIAFLVVISASAKFNLTAVSYDSIAQILLGKSIGYDGFTESTGRTLASWGVLIPLLQSAAVLLGNDYMYTLQPAFAFSLILTFYYLCYRVVCKVTDKRSAVWMALLATLVLASTYFIFFQAFYIHNSLPAAAYLLVAVSSFWLALQERVYSWLIFGMTALTAFSIARVETPLFALLFLSLLLSTGRLSHRIILSAIIPYLAILIFWYLKLLVMIGNGTDILSPAKIQAIVTLLIIFGIFTLCSNIGIVKDVILPNLHLILAGVLTVAMIGIFIIKPGHMLISLKSISLNMLASGRWGATWFLILSLMSFTFSRAKFLEERLFSLGILFFFILLLLLAYLRIPYSIGWGDSANRIITHIVPITIMYVVVKYSNMVQMHKGNTTL